MQDCVCFDWDDTIMPSTELTRLALEQNVSIDNVVLGEFVMDDIDMSALKLIKECIDNNFKVIIVTNASLGWVLASGLRYLPKTYQYISENKIGVVSAFERHSNQEIMLWKYLTFLEIFEYEGFRSFMSIGDAEYERFATIKLMSSGRYRTTFKTCKFVEGPTFEQLKLQQVNLQLRIAHMMSAESLYIDHITLFF
jgi:hypothetical protein